MVFAVCILSVFGKQTVKKSPTTDALRFKERNRGKMNYNYQGDNKIHRINRVILTLVSTSVHIVVLKVV